MLINFYKKMKRLLLYLTKIGEVYSKTYNIDKTPTCIGGVMFDIHIDTSDYQYAIIEQSYFMEYEDVKTSYKLPLDIIPQKLWDNIKEGEFDESFIISKSNNL